jgi:hypothetical protein
MTAHFVNKQDKANMCFDLAISFSKIEPRVGGTTQHFKKQQMWQWIDQ